MKIDKYVFKRHEIKYMLTPSQYKTVLKEIGEHLSVDEYGKTTIPPLVSSTFRAVALPSPRATTVSTRTKRWR